MNATADAPEAALDGAKRPPGLPRPGRRFGPRLAPALLLALLLGALQTLAFVHTAAWPLPIATLAGLVWTLDADADAGHRAARRAFGLGAAYGTGWLGAGVWWLFVSMHRYGGLPAPMAVAAVALLAGVLSLYLGAACALFVRWRSGRPGADAVLFAALWLLAELARGALFTGFPWLASGYAQVDGPLAALAPWVGVYGIGAVLAWWAAALAGLMAVWRRLAHAPDGADRGAVAAAASAAVGLAGLAALALAGPGAHTRPAAQTTVTLIQPNVPQDEKFEGERIGHTLGALAQELVAAPPGLVVAPETAVPLLPSQLAAMAPDYWPSLRAHFAVPERAALIGMPLGDFDSGYTNAVVGVAAGGTDYRYDKHHLVPFGEFIPPGFRWFTELMNIPLGDFTRGVPVPPSFAFGGQRIAPTICYEDLFGEEIARRFADPAQAPTLLANLSNIGWFGPTVAVPQHLAISRLRALEFQRPVVRATNTGATAVIDHQGRVEAALAPFTQGRLSASVQGREGLTPYARWAARWGLWPLVALGLVVVLSLAWRHRHGARA